MTSLTETAPLPAPARAHARLMATPLGGWLARPWFDSLALEGLTRAYLPASRAWAAAIEAAGSPEAFAEHLGLAGSPRPPRRGLGRIHGLAEGYAEADRRWTDALFAGGSEDAAALTAAWRRASHRLMTARGYLLPFSLRRRLAAVRFDIPSPAEVADRYAKLAADPDGAYLLQEPWPAVERSAAIERGWGREYWLRFAMPQEASGFAYAHVFEPGEAGNAPNFVYANGLGVEVEAYDDIADEFFPLVARGVRLVRLELPYHVRRRQAGFYGGEPFLARQPLGGLDFFRSAVREYARLIAWCRGLGTGRVGIGGTSLGALTAQLAATHARHWPGDCRPDLLFLVTTSARVAALGFESALARKTGLAAALEAAGWTPRKIDAFAGLSDPGVRAPLPARDILMMLGNADRVTPAVRGAQLAELWRLPSENLFSYRRGHFSVPLGLLRDAAPLDRLVERLQG